MLAVKVRNHWCCSLKKGGFERIAFGKGVAWLECWSHAGFCFQRGGRGNMWFGGRLEM